MDDGTRIAPPTRWEWHERLEEIRASVRWHRNRQAFYERADVARSLACCLLATACVLPGAAIVWGGATAILCIADLFIGFRAWAIGHDVRARDLIELEIAMVTTPISEDALAEVAKKRRRIEAGRIDEAWQRRSHG